MKALLFSIFISISTLSGAQKIVFEVSDSLMGKFDCFAVDNFGKIYVTQKDVIMVFSPDLDTLFTTSLKSIRPSSIESSKSFRTLLFDDDRSVIQFLDNTGTAIQDEIDLVNLDIQQPILVCESFGGNTIWILDAGNLRLIKINDKLETVLITENLTTIFDGGELPTQMKEVNDNLLVLIPGKGVARFDVFGTYIDLYPCDARSLDARGDYLFIRTSTSLEIIPLKSLLEPDFVYDIPKGVENFAFTRELVYLKQKNRIVIGKYVKKEK